jgi:hypothetical protein
MNEEKVIAMFEKIIDGCRNVKEEPDLHKNAKELATLIIRDCNLSIREIRNGGKERMRAKEEYEKWCYEGCGGYLPSEEGRKSYTTGFNRAIELMEELMRESLKDKEDE